MYVSQSIDHTKPFTHHTSHSVDWLPHFIPPSASIVNMCA